ncbi:MAG: YceI family protein [Terracidiphilus sp.]
MKAQAHQPKGSPAVKRLAVTIGILALAAPLVFAQTSAWKSDPAHSEITFTVRHLGVANVHGSFGGVNATILYDKNAVAESSVTATIGVNTLNTGEDGRDEVIKSSGFFDTDRFPTATFISSRISKNGRGLLVRGNLTLHGVTRPVVLDVEGPTPPVRRAGNRPHSSFSATATIDRTAFGIGNSFPNAIVGDQVQLRIDLKIIEQ